MLTDRNKYEEGWQNDNTTLFLMGTLHVSLLLIISELMILLLPPQRKTPAGLYSQLVELVHSFVHSAPDRGRHGVHE